MVTVYFPPNISWLATFHEYLPSVFQTILFLWQTFHYIKFCCVLCRANDFFERKMGTEFRENIMRNRLYFVVLNSSEL